MKTKSILSVLFVLIGFCSLAQIRSNMALGGQISTSSAFLDASSTISWNNSKNSGKGLLFPRVDLVQFTSFSPSSGAVGLPTNYPSRFDGMVVYNTATGKAGIGGTDLRPGFYFYFNKTTNVAGGTWVRIGDGYDLSVKEDNTNKSNSTTLGTSDVLYPTQNAVKTYVDNLTGAVNSGLTNPSTGNTVGDLFYNTTDNKLFIYNGSVWNPVNTDNQIITLTGDVTGSGTGSFGATIASDAITSAKIANGTIANVDLDKANISLSGFGEAISPVSLGNQKITNLANPTNGADAANKSYVDAIAASGVPDASNSVKGKLMLAGDLSGPAEAPTVPGLATKEPLITAGTPAQYFRGDKTFQSLDKAAVGLANVNNTSDMDKPVSNLTRSAIDLKEDAANKSTATTLGTSDVLFPTQNAVKTYVDQKLAWNERTISGSDIDLYPANANVKQIHFTNTGAGLTLFQVRNDDNAATYSGAVLELKGSGADYTNNVYFGKYGANFWVPQMADRGAFMSDKSIAFGSVGTGTSIYFYGGGGYSNPTELGILNSTGLKLNSLSASQIVETSAAGYLSSTTKKSAYNKDFGTTVGTVAEGSSLALKENVANKSTATTLGTSDVLFPTQNAVKTYVDSKVVASATDKIQDADKDTKIQVEKIANDDEIHFDIAGAEKWVMRGSRLEAINSLQSVFIGEGSGVDATGEANTFIGYQSGLANKSGEVNTALGAFTLSSNLTGTDNTAIGYSSLKSNTQGYNNVGLGSVTLFSNISGINNSAVGISALYLNTSGSSNVANGTRVLGSNTTGNNNVAIGYQADSFNQEGNNNVVLGYEAGRGTAVHSKSGNVFLGYQSGYNEAGSNKLYIENSNSTTPLIYGEFDTNLLRVNGNLDITGDLQIRGGSPAAGKVLTSDASGNASWQTSSGGVVDASLNDKGKLKLAGDLSGTAEAPTVPGLATKEPLITAGTPAQYFRGDKTFQSLDKAAVGLANVNNTSDMDKPVSNLTSTALSLKEDAANKSADGTLSSNSDVKFPTEKAVKTYVDSNVSQWTKTGTGLFHNSGDRVGVNNTQLLYLPDQTKFFGSLFLGNGGGSLRCDDPGMDEGGYNTFVGISTGLANTTGQYNTATGAEVLSANTIGQYNTALGYYSLNKNISGTSNTAIGADALEQNTTGNNNVAVGSNASFVNSTGERNIAIGTAALAQNITGSGNVAIGHLAGSYSNNLNNSLFIDNTGFGRGNETLERQRALIYGKFDDAASNQFLTLNGKFTVNNGEGDPDGVTPGPNGYTLPTTRGNAGEIMTANADGSTSWTSATAVSSPIKNEIIIDQDMTIPDVQGEAPVIASYRLVNNSQTLTFPQSEYPAASIIYVSNDTNSETLTVTGNNSPFSMFYENGQPVADVIIPAMSASAFYCAGGNWYVVNKSSSANNSGGFAVANGLTDNAGTVELGGLLTKSTEIDGDVNLDFGNNTPLKNMNLTISNSYEVQTKDVGDFNMSTGTGIVLTDLRSAGEKKGIEYADNYSADFTDRSLVDKAYVDAMLPKSFTCVGGNYNADTYPKPGTQHYRFYGNTSFHFNPDEMDADGNMVILTNEYMNDVNVFMGDGVALTGMIYDMDETILFDGNNPGTPWVAKKGYTYTLVAAGGHYRIMSRLTSSSGGAALSVSNGLTDNSGTVELGGLLTNSTEIDGDVNLDFGNNTPLRNMNLTISNSYEVQTKDVGDFNMSTGTGIVLSDLRAAGDQRGIEYAADYSADFTERSLVDKAYVDAQANRGQSIQGDYTQPDFITNNPSMAYYRMNPVSSDVTFTISGGLPDGFVTSVVSEYDGPYKTTVVPGGVAALFDETGQSVSSIDLTPKVVYNFYNSGGNWFLGKSGSGTAGSGGIVAGDGLTNDNGTIHLGGFVTGNKNILMDGSNSNNNFSILSVLNGVDFSGGYSGLVWENGDFLNNPQDAGLYLACYDGVSTTRGAFVTTYGLRYRDDYSQFWDDNYLVDKRYVDNAVAAAGGGGGGAISVGNGLTDNSGTLELGGLLTNSTEIDGDVNLDFGNNTPLRNMNMTISNSYEVQTKDVGDFNMSTGTGIVLSDLRAAGDQSGIEYAADYSADFTDRSLVDKAYVDSKLGGGSAVASSGSDGDIQIADGSGSFRNATSFKFIDNDYFNATNTTSTNIGGNIQLYLSDTNGFNVYNHPNSDPAIQLSTYNNGSTHQATFKVNALHDGGSIIDSYGQTTRSNFDFHDPYTHDHFLSYDRNPDDSWTLALGSDRNAGSPKLMVTDSKVYINSSSGSYSLPENPGSEGNVLTYHDNGTTSWEDAGSGGGGGASGWSLTGNASTDPSINYIGTSDLIPLVFRANSVKAGCIDVQNFNTSFGSSALNTVMSGRYNVALGAEALMNTDGSSNVAIGYAAGKYATESDRLYIDNRDRGSEMAGKTDALIYGIFDASPASQELNLNAQTFINGTLTIKNKPATNLKSASIVAPSIDYYTLPTTGGYANQVILNDGAGHAYWGAAPKPTFAELFTTFVFPDTFGGDKQVLTSNGNGTTYWADPSASGGGVTPIDGIFKWDGTAYNAYSDRQSASDGQFYLENNNTSPILADNTLNYAGGLAAYTDSYHALMGVSNSGYGVYAKSTSYYGLYAYSGGSHGVKAIAVGTGDAHGVDAASTWGNGVQAVSTYGHGVYARSSNGTGSAYGLFAESTTNIAAVFNSTNTARTITEFRSGNTARLKVLGSGIAQYTADYSASMTDNRMIPDIGKVASMIAAAGGGGGGASHDAVTLGTANGLSLATQVLSLGLATTSASGAMSAADKTLLSAVAGTAEASKVLVVDASKNISGINTLEAAQIKLTAGAALNKILTSDASGNATWQDAPSAGSPALSLLTDQIYIGVGDVATARAISSVPVSKMGFATANLSMGNGTTNFKIVNLNEPTNSGDAATKNYVDQVAGAFTKTNDLISGGDNNDNFVFGDTQMGAGTITRNVDGHLVYSKLFFNANKAVVRAGGFDMAGYMQDENLGIFSTAFGYDNMAKGEYSVVAGGGRNVASGGNSSVGGGLDNRVQHNYGTIGGGVGNKVTGLSGTVVGGQYNVAQSWGETVIGTYNDSISYVSSRTAPIATDRLFVIGNGIGSGGTPRSNALVMLKNGNTTVTGDWTGPAFTSPSDVRLKENIKTLTEVIEKLKQVRGVEFDWKVLADNPTKRTGHDIGVVAQELQKVFPGLVHQREDGYLTVDYAKLSAILLQAINEQQQQLDAMNQRLSNVEKLLVKP